MKKVSVECRNIRLAYGRTDVLKDVSIAVEPGEFFALLGPSGSGKSTLLRLIAGFNQQQHGQVFIDGVDVGAQPPWLRNVGMVFQSYALWPHLTVWDNVAFGLVERKVEKAALRARVGAALELVGLSAHGGRRPNQLSGGQQQRVALARTIVIEPQVLLLDEPLSNLDKTLRVQMRRELLALQRRLGLTTIFVTHDQEEAMSTADRMAVLDQGVVQQVGAPMALYDDPVNAFVAGFVGTTNVLPGRVTRRNGDGSVTLAIEGVGEVDVPSPGDRPSHAAADSTPAASTSAGAAPATMSAAFRPHSFSVEAAGAARDPRRAWMDGTVEESEFLGESTRYRVRVGPHSLAVDQIHTAAMSKFPVGAAVSLGLDPTQARLFAS